MNGDQFRKALQDGDPEVRRRAVVAAGASLGRDFGPPLMQALGDADWRVRKEAVQLANRCAVELGIVDDLVLAICQGDNVGLRNAALDVLEELGQAAAPALIAALPTAPEHARKFVVEALGESGGERVVEELAKAALSDDANVAGEAIEALARIGGPAAEAAIRGRLTASDAFLRLAALDALNRRDAFISWEELKPLLDDRLLRRVALTALGRTGHVEALDPLLEALEESTLHTVGVAASALTRLLGSSSEIAQAAEARLSELSERARTWLRAVLASGQDADARRAAAELLARARDVEALASIVNQLAHEAPSAPVIEALRGWGLSGVDPMLTLLSRLDSAEERAVALELAADLALVHGTPTEDVRTRVKGALRRSLLDSEHAVVAAAARCLVLWADEEDADMLVGHAMSAEPAIARAAARALETIAERSPDSVERALAGTSFDGLQGAVLAPVIAKIGGPHAIDRLQALMSADDAEVRRAALHGLGRVGGERAAGLVALALADEDNEVQIVAAQVLGRLRDENGDAPGVSGLVNAVGSEFAHVRAAVARALGQTGSLRAVDTLCEMLGDEDSGVAMAAVEALGQISPGELAQSLKGALHHHDPEVVKAALRALANGHDPAAPSELIQALSHPAWDVRQLSAELLASLCVVEAEPALRAALARETDDLAREALEHALTAVAGGA